MDESTDSINAAERARSNYSVHRLKGSKVPKRYGETRGQYLWRLLRVFIKETIESVAKSDVEERVVGHGVSFLRSMRAGSRIKSLCYDIHQKEVVALESSDILNFYMSDGRFVKNMFAVDLNQDTTNKFIKYIVPNKSYDTILYCSHERQFLGWKKGEKEINLFSSAFELLSVAKSPDPIDCLGYNSRTGDVATCSSNNEVTLWNFRYGAKHLIPKATYKNFLVANRRHNFIVIEPSDPPMIRCYIVSNIDVTVINLYDGTVISTKDELHIRQITAVTFYNRMKYLITASKEGSIKVWDQKWFLKMVFVGHNGCVNALAIHPFSSYVISAGADRTLRVWSLDQQDVIEKLDVDEPVLDITTEFGNPKFITYSSDMIKIWKVTHIYEMFTNIGRRISKLTELNHRQFPKRTLVQCESGGMHLVNPATGNVLTSLIIDVKEKVVDSVYAVCEDTVFVYLENGDLLKVNAKANPCRIIQRKTDFPKPISTMLIYEYYSDGSYEPEKQDFDSEFNYLNQTSSVYKTLKTKSPKELSGVKLKGFDRTLLFAGCKDGSICMLRWDNLEIDYEVEV